MAKPGKSSKPRRKAPPAKGGRLYTVEVSVFGNSHTSVASRTLELPGNQTLEMLHRAIASAFEHVGDYSYEFQFHAGAPHPEGKRYVLPAEFDVDADAGNPAAGCVNDTTLDDLALVAGLSFAYYPDAVDDWWHRITVERVQEGVPAGKYPKVIKQVGTSPFGLRTKPRAKRGIGKDEGADTACLVGEVHLKKGEYEKAVEAFTRAIETHPTADAYEGRAKAYRALAAEDVSDAERLKQG